MNISQYANKFGAALALSGIFFKDITEEKYDDVKTIGDDLALLDVMKESIIDFERLLVNRLITLSGDQ